MVYSFFFFGKFKISYANKLIFLFSNNIENEEAFIFRTNTIHWHQTKTLIFIFPIIKETLCYLRETYIRKQ